MKSFYLRRFLIVLIGTACFAVVRAQTIVHGNVTDAATKAPVSSATISVKWSKLATSTNMEQEF